MVNGECFALDYMLAERAQCSYTQASGVCPDTALSSDPSTNQVRPLSCEKVGGSLGGFAGPVGGVRGASWGMNGRGWAAGSWLRAGELTN